MAFTHPFKISAVFASPKTATVALFITLEVSHFLVWQDVLWMGVYRCGEIALQVVYLILSPSASLYFSGQPWDNGITLCLPHPALDERTEASGKRNKMAVKMQTLEVKKGAPNNLPLNLKEPNEELLDNLSCCLLITSHFVFMCSV